MLCAETLTTPRFPTRLGTGIVEYKHIYLSLYLSLQGVRKKSLHYVWKAIEPLRIEVGIKVRGFSERAGAELSWAYHNFSVAQLGPEIFEFKVSLVPKIIFLM